jgi:glycosyltransferase involved in cell wall biosynthesis
MGRKTAATKYNRSDDRSILLSIVVPMYNEEDNIAPFLARVEAVCQDVVGPLEERYEIICVDDGSSDATVSRLLTHSKRNPAIRIVGLSRNFGKDTALSAGLDHASGAAVIPIDADLQDPPELIPELFAKRLVVLSHPQQAGRYRHSQQYRRFPADGPPGDRGLAALA